jgi:hypothetical protein
MSSAADLPDVSSIGSKRRFRRPPATLHGVVFDIFGGSPATRRDCETSCLKAHMLARLLLQQSGAPERFERVSFAFAAQCSFPAEFRIPKSHDLHVHNARWGCYVGRTGRASSPTDQQAAWPTKVGREVRCPGLRVDNWATEVGAGWHLMPELEQPQRIPDFIESGLRHFS